jgi:hypothetical protein
MRKHSYRATARQKYRFRSHFVVVSSIIWRRCIAGTTQNQNTILSAIFLVFRNDYSAESYTLDKEIGRLVWDNRRKLSYFTFNPNDRSVLDISPLAAPVSIYRNMPVWGEEDKI